MFGALLYAKLFSIPILVSYHTHIPQYIPQYTWAGLVEPMWKLIRFCVRAADVTLVVLQPVQGELGTCTAMLVVPNAMGFHGQLFTVDLAPDHPDRQLLVRNSP